MGMSEFYGAHDDAGSIATIRRAPELGVNFLNTADLQTREPWAKPSRAAATGLCWYKSGPMAHKRAACAWKQLGHAFVGIS
jgi:hypothetical protein